MAKPPTVSPGTATNAAPGRLPASARLPLVLLISLGTALIFHGVFWLLWTFVRNRF